MEDGCKNLPDAGFESRIALKVDVHALRYRVLEVRLNVFEASTEGVGPALAGLPDEVDLGLVRNVRIQFPSGASTSVSVT